MIWLAWRRQRAVILASAAFTGAVIAALLVLRFAAAARLSADGLTGCHIDECPGEVVSAFRDDFGTWAFPLVMVLFALPPLLGIFAGAPLFARESEQGTHVLALTQSVGRVRWWATKVLVAAVPLLATALALGLTADWTMRSMHLVFGSAVQTPRFETSGVVVAGYALLAFALAATGGLVLRNTVGAMAVAVGLYAVLLVLTGNVLRPGYAEPLRTEAAVVTGDKASVDVPAGVWIVRIGYLGPDENVAGWRPTEACHDAECMAAHGVTSLYVDYHPDSRYWRFQFIEAAGMTAAALLAGLAGRLALRRLRA